MGSLFKPVQVRLKNDDASAGDDPERGYYITFY